MNSTSGEKLTVVLTSFGLACAAFFFAVVALIPITGAVFQYFAVPALITQLVVCCELFGLPIVAAIYALSWFAPTETN